MNLTPHLKRVGIDPAGLRRPDAYVDYEAICRLLESCATAWDLPDIACVTRHQHIDILVPVALIARMERDVRSAMKEIIANLVAASNVVVAVLDESGDTASLTLDVRDNARHSTVFAELLLAEGEDRLDSVAGSAIDLLQVELRQTPGASARAIKGHFGCPVMHNAQRNAWFSTVRFSIGQSNGPTWPIMR
jgi:hypothetical protein